MITLDGSQGEGGGALVRVALALSTLTNQELHITNIRSNRSQPGLKAQHLVGIETLKTWCHSTTNNIDLGSTDLVYCPGHIGKGIFYCNIGTAGSITLLLQTILPPALFAPGKVTFKIQGGTCGKGQASIDYFKYVLLPYLQRFAVIECKILKRGYYPTGGGEVHISVTPNLTMGKNQLWNDFLPALQQKIPPICLAEQEKLLYIKGVINCSLDLAEKEVAERICKTAQMYLSSFNVPINISIEYARTTSTGGEILLYGIFGRNRIIDVQDDIKNQKIVGESLLLEKNVSSEQLGKNAAEKLKKIIESKAVVDDHLADQLIIYASLLPGSRFRPSVLSSHAKTNISVVEQFLPTRFTIKENLISTSLFGAQDL